MFDDIDIAIEYCQTKFQVLKLIVTIDWQFNNIDIEYWLLTCSWSILILADIFDNLARSTLGDLAGPDHQLDHLKSYQNDSGR